MTDNEKLFFDSAISDPEKIANPETLVEIVEKWISKVKYDNDKKDIENDTRIRHNRDIDGEIEQIEQTINVIKESNKELAKRGIKFRKQLNENRSKIEDFENKISIFRNSYQHLIPDEIPSTIFISVRYRGDRTKPSTAINLWNGSTFKSRNGVREILSMDKYLEVDLKTNDWRERIRNAIGYGMGEYNVIDKKFTDEGSVGDILVHIIAPENLEQYDTEAQNLKEQDEGHCIYDIIEKKLTELLNGNITNRSNISTLKSSIKYVKTLIQEGNGFPVDNLKEAQKIVNKLHVSITIFDVMNVFLGNSVKKFTPTKAFSSVCYVNTRFNHAEYISRDAGKILKKGIMKYKGDFIDITENEINNILINTPYFPMRVLNGYGEISRLFMNDGRVYRVSKPRNLILSDIHKKLNLERYNISVKSRAYNVVKSGVYLAGSLMFNTASFQDNDTEQELYFDNLMDVDADDTKYDEWDMKNAYNNYRSNKYYTGFPVIINEVVSMNYTHENFISNNTQLYEGYYVITNISISSDNKYYEHLLALNIFELSFTVSSDLSPKQTIEYTDNRCLSFPLMMVKMFADIGIKFKVIAGAVSINKEDIKFDEEERLFIKESEIDPIGSDAKLYSLFFGQFAYKPIDKKIQYYGSKSLAKYLKKSDDSVEFVRDLTNIYNYQPDNTNDVNNGFIYRTIKNTNNRTLSHLFGYISGYCVTSVLEQYFNIPFKYVRGIRLDGIYTICNTGLVSDYINHEKFRLKPDKYAFRSGKAYINVKPLDNIFVQSITVDNQISIDDIKNRIIIAKGPGGCGKTHKFINMFNNSVYVAPYHRLISEKKEESKNVNYGYTTYGMGVYGNKYCKINPGVIIKDEWTLEPWTMTKKLMNEYKDSIIILCGDFDIIEPDNSTGNKGAVFYYQLPPIQNDRCMKDTINIMPEVYELKHLIDKSTVVEFTKSYRYNEDDDIHEISEELRSAIKQMNYEKCNASIIVDDTERQTLISNINKRYIRFVYDFITNYKNKYQWILNKKDLLDYYNINDIILASRINCNGDCNSNCKNLLKIEESESKPDNKAVCKARVSHFNNIISSNVMTEKKLYKYIIVANKVYKSDLGIDDSHFATDIVDGSTEYNTIINGNRGDRPYYNGNIIVLNTKIEHRFLEPRYAFTINQYQGSTIGDNRALYIDMNNLSSINLLYTAISRCKSIDQIFFIKDQ